MGFQTDLFTTLTFSRETFNSRYDVEEQLNDTEKLIKHYENKLYSLGVMTEPKKYCGDEEDPLAFINVEIKSTLEELKDCYIDQYKLELVLETWDKTHDADGYAIKRPDNLPWDASYIDGDFIRHKEDNL